MTADGNCQAKCPECRGVTQVSSKNLQTMVYCCDANLRVHFRICAMRFGEAIQVCKSGALRTKMVGYSFWVGSGVPSRGAVSLFLKVGGNVSEVSL